MEIYVLKDSKRLGPFLPFKLRELLEDNEFLPSDKGWIEGMDDWAPLSEIEAVSTWMPRDPATPPPLPDPEVTARQAAAIREVESSVREVEARRVRAWLRWLARTLDEMLWFALIWVIGVQCGWFGLWDFIVRHLILLLGPPLLWIPVEALLLSRFGTTPGKWLLGIRVTDDLGQALTYRAALKRSALVLVTGNGLGLPSLVLLPVLQGGMAWILYRRSGTTLWDRAAGSQLSHVSPNALGFILSGMVLAAWVALSSWITLTAPLPPDLPEDQHEQIRQMRQQFEENSSRLKGKGAAPS